MSLLLTVSMVALHAVALYGWGRALEHRIGLRPSSVALSTCLGLAWLVVLGGVLDAAGWIGPLALNAVVAIGLVLAASRVREAYPRIRRTQHTLSAVCAVLVVVVVALYFLGTVVPALAFDYNDDFQKYFVHPARMLQVGRVQGSSLSAIGFETLGGQAWLHSFVLSLAGFDALNVLDLGLGLGLCLALAGLGPTQRPGKRLASWLAMAAVLCINPQIVNVSSTYTGSALFLAFLLLSVPRGEEAPELNRAHAVACGLVLAALCALKTSYVLLAVGLGATWTLALAFRGSSFWLAARWSVACAVTTCIGLAPWLIAHAPSYLAALHSLPPHPAPPRIEAYSVNPLSTEALTYGNRYIDYTMAVTACLVLGLVTFIRAPKTAAARPWPAYAALAASSCLASVYLVMLYVVAPLGHGDLTSIRLFVPMLLGILPGVLILSAEATPSSGPLALFTALLLGAGPLVPFAAALPGRLQHALAHGSVLAFGDLASKPWYLAYNEDVLHGRMQRRVADAQAAIPAGEPFVAWISAPFWLDFRRNPITDLDLAGLETPWSNVPEVRYVMWEYNGPATGQIAGFEAERRAPGRLQARIGDAGMRLSYVMIDLARHCQVVHNDGQLMVLRVSDPSALRDRYGGR